VHTKMKFREGRLALPMLCLYLFYGLICALFVAGILAYPGQGSIYILFSIVSNTLLYFGFRKNAFFFDTFIAIFFWLGFWLKLTIRVIFMKGVFYEVDSTPKCNPSTHAASCNNSAKNTA
jgi:hypothetical protein